MRKKLLLLISLLAISLSLIQLYQSIFGIWEAYLARSLLIAISLMALFLIHPLSKKEHEGKLSFGIDVLLVALTVGVGLYMIINRGELVAREGMATTIDLWVGGLLILLVLEATRRAVGYAIVAIIFVLFLYTLFGRYMPGGLLHAGASIREIIDFNFLTFDGVLGVPVAVIVSYIFIYIIFAAFLIQAKIPDFFKNASYALMGRQTGGIGKVAVLSSAFMGSITGSAVANVMTTGSYTIPAMKESGYPPTFAGAIEASASTGGQIMPPIMGSAGFLLAAYVGVPYITVAIAAAIPAILYFASVGISVHSSCLKYGLTGMSKERLPRIRDVLKKTYLLLPIVVMVFILVQGYSPLRSGFYAIIATILVSFITKETMLTPKKILLALENGARAVLQITAVCASAGIIVLLLLLSGLGMKMPSLISNLTGDNLLFTAIVVAIGVIVLSIGLPSNAAYIIGATMLAPVLIAPQLNITMFSAHFFVLYFAVMSNITPPVSLASYAAASLAGTNLWRTAIRAFTLAISGLIIPFIFIREPALLLEGSFYRIVIAIIITLMTVTSLSFALHGFFRGKINPLFRTLLFIIPIMVLISYYVPGYNWLITPAFILFAFVMMSDFLWQKLGKIKMAGKGSG